MKRLGLVLLCVFGFFASFADHFWAAQTPAPQPLPDVLGTLTLKEFSVDATGRVEKCVFAATYFSRMQVAGWPVTPTLKGGVEFDLVKLGDRQIVLTHADALTGKVIHRHFSALDAVLLLKAISDLQWFEAMPPPTSASGPIIVAVQLPPPPPPSPVQTGLGQVAHEMAQRRAQRIQPATTGPP